MSPVWEYIAWSINVMSKGVYPTTRFRRGAPPWIPGLDPKQQAPGLWLYPDGISFRLTEVRADWKEHVSSFRLQHHYTCKRICHQCEASRSATSYPFTDFRQNASWQGTFRTHRQFLLEELGEPTNMLVYTAKFHFTVIKWDTMHSVNLGAGLHANGGAWFELLKIKWFGEGDKNLVFRSAFRLFKRFLARNKIQCSQPVFKPWMLVTSGEEYCFFTSKVPGCYNKFSFRSKYVLKSHAICLSLEAQNSRVLTSWLAYECHQASQLHPSDGRLALTALCMHELHRWYSMFERAGRYLTQADPYWE